MREEWKRACVYAVFGQIVQFFGVCRCVYYIHVAECVVFGKLHTHWKTAHSRTVVFARVVLARET